VAVNYDGPNAYYTASVSIDHDDVPTAHWPLYNAILRAKEKGMRNFQFGYLEIDESFEQKQRAIAHFKSGFAPDFTRHIWWYVHVHGSAS
jgi:lipid II:glycine glycyltransferase (peptidoglycan interpeptide bridge formation enzyme)